jgi:hypothetical protein
VGDTHLGDGRHFPLTCALPRKVCQLFLIPFCASEAMKYGNNDKCTGSCADSGGRLINGCAAVLEPVGSEGTWLRRDNRENQ